ncbi:hypothetical protein Ocin01_00677 [Orchesella cincta]|uniref:Histone deacetylase complex subunit SAP130 C-terminal domain-containing protein n=1 Tax=Orchesella cincta TaxID=48709 RepID=A0A1D2NKZ9_ORCCI|nr:hypothetical protein Ocin01_00677 [Orchesella cincta]
MSTQCTGGSATLEKAEVHTESIQQVQPIDLASRSAGGQVVQLRPVRAFSTHVTAKAGGGPTVVNAPIISVNRPGNLTLLPARGAPGQPAGVQATQAISTYQIARVGNMRSATLTTGQQPASITVTPISASNAVSFGSFGANIRLTGATVNTVNNGSWIQAGAQTFSSPIRAATITVGGRAVRPETKMIHIPPQGSVQHVTQLQMVDTKGSILKPSITTTPIVNIRGALQGGASTCPSVTIPIAPFTIRTANMANIPTIQQRPQTSTPNAANQVQKVIAQPAHGAPIQFVNANVNKNVIQAITTPLPRLNVNAVCLTLSTNANLAPNTSSPVVAVASKHGPTGLIMTPSLAPASGPGGMPLAKVIPVGRDGSTSIVDSFFAQPNSSTSNAVTVSAVSASGTQVSNSGLITSTNVVLASPNTNQGISNSVGQGQPHHVVHVQGPINAVGLPPPNIASGSIAPGYYVEKNGNLSLLQTHPQQNRPIALEKRVDGKGIAAGSMILTTQHPHLPPGSGGQGTTVTIPIAAHGTTQHVSFAHPISVSHQGGQHQLQGSAQILTPISAQAHHLSNTVLSTMSPTISVPTPSSQSHIGHLSMPSGYPHAIPTHVISQPPGTVSSSSASSTPANVITVTTTVANTSSVSVTNSNTMSNSATSVSVSTSNSTSTMPSSTSSSCSSMNNTNSLSTAAPAQSPNTKSTTHSPRPSILRKQRELGDNHIPARAQRNLTLQLNFAGSNSTSSSNPIAVTPSSASAAAVAAASNNNNSSNSSSGGLSILRKEFQPPNEESSWQSCSSHTSGSTTISATSETAEYQLNQIPSSNSTIGLDISLSMNNCESVPTTSSLGSTAAPISQNGVVRSISSGTQGKGVHRNSSKLQHKDIERLKRDKEDSVSPRKKPRKQQLTTSDLLESASPEISFYHARGKKFRRMENNIFDGYNNAKPGAEAQVEEPSPPKVVCVIKKPRVSLLSSNHITMGKTRLNHFEHHSEVKAKEERRPTIAELANQKNIMHKVSGWKIQHMTNQMEQVVDLEASVVNSFKTLLTRLEGKVGPNCADRDINRILELLKGNIQRCKVIHDQMTESRLQALRILDHKPRIVDVIGKHMTKKPVKKRDRL